MHKSKHKGPIFQPHIVCYEMEEVSRIQTNLMVLHDKTVCTQLTKQIRGKSASEYKDQKKSTATVICYGVLCMNKYINYLHLFLLFPSEKTK